MTLLVLLFLPSKLFIWSLYSVRLFFPSYFYLRFIHFLWHTSVVLTIAHVCFLHSVFLQLFSMYFFAFHHSVLCNSYLFVYRLGNDFHFLVSKPFFYFCVGTLPSRTISMPSVLIFDLGFFFPLFQYWCLFFLNIWINPLVPIL